MFGLVWSLLILRMLRCFLLTLFLLAAMDCVLEMTVFVCASEEHFDLFFRLLYPKD